MSEFYKELSDNYDLIFPPESEITGFLARGMKNRRRLLDIACGTGTYAIELGTRGFDVTGIDNEERMVMLAREKPASKNVVFSLADMEGTVDEENVFSGRYDGAYCIGNSLPHLGSIAQVNRAVSLWYDALYPGGVLVVQIVNFKRFMKTGNTELPAVERDGFTFARRYDIAGPKSVDFVATLSSPHTEKMLTNTVRLHVIDADSLHQTLNQAGFGAIEFFGGYDRRAYDEENSFLLIALAQKG